MSVFARPTERIPGVTISLGDSVHIPTAAMSRQARTKHMRSVSEANKLPPAVAVVPAEHVRGYIHSKRVNNYLIGNTLGEGSFAKVKEGFHVLVGEKVAMKIIDKKKAQQDPYVAKTFRREAKLLQMVRHPNILQLFEVIETDSSFYLISELCSGGELMKYIYKKLKLDENETRKFMRQIVSAVDHLHKAGIIHRDLKVENMLLDSNMDIKIIDFGLSNEEFVEGENGHNIHCNTQCGSPAYAAPELLGHKEYGKEVDIWSIGVNMYAMLTGCLPYTVEPFNITALHAKMLENKMNPIPEHLSSDCKDLLRCLLRSNPSERITMAEIMEHPWMNEGHHLPFGPHPFPNRLRHHDICEEIVEHMVHTLNVKDSMEELKQELLTNRSTSATAVYYLLEARLNRYRLQHIRRVMKVSTHKPKRFSRDQGFYEGEDDDHSDTTSVASTPVRPRYSRQHSRRHTLKNDTLTRRERPISFPSDETEDALTAVQAPSRSSFDDRRKSIPPMVLEKEIVTFTARKRDKEKIQKHQKGFEGRKASTLPRKFSMGSYQREPAKSHQHKAPTQKQVQRTHSPQDPYEYDLPIHISEPAESTPTRPTTVHMVRNGFSHSHELNQIRHDLNNTLHPPTLNTKAWHSNPTTRTSSRNPSRHGSRTPSRVPSGSSVRTPPQTSAHLNIIDDDVEELTFHEVESHNLVISGGEKHERRRRAFTIGGEEMMEQDDHLPSLQATPHHTPTRRHTTHEYDVSERRNGFSSQPIIFQAPTDLDKDAIITEFLEIAERMKMRHLVSGRNVVSGVLKGVQIQIEAKKDLRGMCHVAFQWLSGGDQHTYKNICDTFMHNIQL